MGGKREVAKMSTHTLSSLSSFATWDLMLEERVLSDGCTVF